MGNHHRLKAAASRDPGAPFQHLAHLPLGASRQMIMGQFMIESMTLAGVGGLVGIAVGLCGSKIITYCTHWEGIFPATLFAAPVLFALVVGMVFGLLPARRAARLNPVESLRHE